MILGMSLANFTFLHVALSLIGIGAGFFVIFGFLKSIQLRILTALFFSVNDWHQPVGLFLPQ